jgi:hypothetical protein
MIISCQRYTAGHGIVVYRDIDTWQREAKVRIWPVNQDEPDPAFDPPAGHDLFVRLRQLDWVGGYDETGQMTVRHLTESGSACDWLILDSPAIAHLTRMDDESLRRVIDEIHFAMQQTLTGSLAVASFREALTRIDTPDVRVAACWAALRLSLA